ncbi:MAG: hypothetical protein KF845_01250 [Cyclobacteriaceae bacterium]|nr:hypothetical protein [Cyclobacteriaceae bacterium]
MSSRPLSRHRGSLPAMTRKFFSWPLLAFLLSCSNERFDAPIPVIPFQDLTLNLSLPENNSLSTVGGYRDLSLSYPDRGVRGIIVYRKDISTFYAFERNCSYQPNDACATVDVHTSTFFMQDTCCGSTFDWDGNPTGGIAWRPLRQYETFLNGNVLTITDAILNH